MKDAAVDLSAFRTVHELAHAVAQMPEGSPRYALLLGAGASVLSGIPEASRLCRSWKMKVHEGLAQKKETQTPFDVWERDHFTAWKEAVSRHSPERHTTDYSLLFSHCFGSPDQRQGYIENLVEGKEPGPGYLYLASLIAAQRFNIVLTTNFDNLIHDALFRYAGESPVVCAFDSQISSVRLSSPRPKIIKLHGDFLYSNIRNITSEVSRLDKNMQDKFKKTCEDVGLIVIGYGGADDSIMGPLRAMLTQEEYFRGGLHWCVYAKQLDHDYRDPEPMGDKIAVPEEVYRLWERHREKVHLYLTPTFDEVMEAIYTECKCQPPRDISKPEERALYKRLVEGLTRGDNRHRVTPTFEALLDSFREAAVRPFSRIDVALDEADSYHKSGIDAVNKDDTARCRYYVGLALSAASGVLESAEVTAEQRLRAFARRAGSLTTLAESYADWELAGPDASGLEPGDRRAEFGRLAEEALKCAREAYLVGEPSPHVRNVWFNGLIASLYRWVARERNLSPEEWAQAIEWHGRIAEKVPDWVNEVRDEIPYRRRQQAKRGAPISNDGADFLEEIARRRSGDNPPDPPPTPPEAGGKGHRRQGGATETG